MVKSYSHEDHQNFSRNKSIKKNEIEDDSREDNKSYLNIWNLNPSFKDIINKISIGKAVFLIILLFFIIISSYILFQNLTASIWSGLILIIVFIIGFHDEFFMFENLFSTIFHSKISIEPFKHLIFWYDSDDPTTLFISNRKDLTHIAIRIYRVDTIAENVHSSIKQFVKALSSKNVRLPFSYQVVQKPIMNLFKKDAKRNLTTQSIDSVIASIYFSVFYDIKGILTERKIDNLRYHVKKFSNTLKSNFIGNFHHFQATLLSDIALINAIRTFFVKETSKTASGAIKRKSLNGNRFNIFVKAGVSIILLLYFEYIFFSFHFPMLYVISINLILIGSIIIIWWRAIFFGFTKNKLIGTPTIDIINPFNNIEFFKLRKYPSSLFIYIENQLLIGVKMVNLRYLFQKPFCLIGKFLEALNNHQISFSYTLKNKPINYYEFYKHGLKHVHEKIQTQLLWDKLNGVKNEVDAERWLGYRYGLWYSILTLSVNSYRFMSSIEEHEFDEVEEELTLKLDTLRVAFNSNFQNYEIEDLRSRFLLSGYLFSTLKNNNFRLNGSHLNYIMLQGTTLSPLTTIVDTLKKGTITKIAAEFNTPLYLENFITIGHTINTEVLENEVPFGFTSEQLKNLLIVNGTSLNRELTFMKIVIELIKAGVPSLVFDFNGTWSKLIHYFNDTHFKKELLYFKLGSAFIIDPLISDIPYDSENTEYLEYMFDAFGLAFRKDQREIEMFRNTIRKKADMDLPSIQLDLQTAKDWEKNPINDSLLTLFSDFTQQDLTYFQSSQGDTKNQIRAYDFVKNSKTVIVDLSILRDLDKQLFFVFLIISKIIHYIKHSKDYIEKTIFVPNIDIFFNSGFLDWKMHYGKINTFLDPLIHHGFGLVFSANQIRYLHSHIFNYFHNIISFKATDKRDISTLKSQMNLQELYGTGYYTSNRNNTYQIEYLMNMKNNEVLIRRDDIYQPFPASIEWNKIKDKTTLPYEDILHFMKTQGYDLHYTERKIIERAKKTFFEKDLGNYVIYINEIINFLDELKTIDQIGNLYTQKLKSHLKEILYPKLLKRTKNKQQMKAIRDNIFNILIKHGYLIENHPRRASGSEALRTSYSVGEQYQIALDDYFKTKGNANAEINVEILEKEITDYGEQPNIFPSKLRKYIIQKEQLKDALMREFSDFNYDLFKIYSFINEKEFQTAIKIQYGLIKKFLLRVYQQYHNIAEEVPKEELEQFFSMLGDIQEFPFSKQELMEKSEKYRVIDLEKENIEILVQETYQFIYDFFIKIQHFIYGE